MESLVSPLCLSPAPTAPDLCYLFPGVSHFVSLVLPLKFCVFSSLHCRFVVLPKPVLFGLLS